MVRMITCFANEYFFLFVTSSLKDVGRILAPLIYPNSLLNQ